VITRVNGYKDLSDTIPRVRLQRDPGGRWGLMLNIRLPNGPRVAGGPAPRPVIYNYWVRLEQRDVEALFPVRFPMGMSDEDLRARFTRRAMLRRYLATSWARAKEEARDRGFVRITSITPHKITFKP